MRFRNNSRPIPLTLRCGLALLPGTCAFAQGVHNEVTVTIDEGVTVSLEGAFENTAEGEVLLQGAMAFSGDFTNEGSFDASGTGELALTGDGTQQISGLDGSPVGTLSVMGGGQAQLFSPLQIESALWLDAGILALGEHDLTILPGAVIEGQGSASNMIATTGAGSLRLPVDGAGVYHFPIGTLAGGPAYTPISLELIDFEAGASTFLTARIDPSVSGLNPSLNNYVDRAWYLDSTGDFTLQDAVATFAWNAFDEVGTIDNLFGGLFLGNDFLLLESVDPVNRQFTARVQQLGVFLAGEQRAFDDDVLSEGDPVDLHVTPSAQSGQGTVDIAAAFGNLPGFTYSIGEVSFRELFSRLELVSGSLEFAIADGMVGESSIQLIITNEYGVTRETTLYIAEQPDPAIARSELNELTGYFEQDFVLQNISTVRALDIVDVILDQMPSEITVARAYLLDRAGDLALAPDSGSVRVSAARILMPGEQTILRVEYISPTRFAPETLVPIYGPYGAFSEATVGGNWLHLAPYGWFYPTEGRWVYHQGFGWAYAPPRARGQLAVYLPNQGWLWSSTSHFPVLYRYSAQSWLYYLEGTSNPAWVFDYGTSEWVTF